jgi:cobalt-zinc-cadmium efflux system outer membrane protein
MLKPGPFSQGIYTVGVSQVLDVWGKRGLRATAADRGIEEQRWRLADAIRQVTHAVRSAFADLVREQAEFGLARDTRTRYDETVRLSRARFDAGDISEAEFDKIELEGLKYRNDEIDAAMQLDLARSALAALLLADPGTLPRASETVVQRRPLAVADLVEQAEGARPDLKAARAALDKAKSALRAARREPWPDPSLGLSYTRDQFTVSGDNGNTFALSLGFGLPFFDRNQAGIAHADNDRQRAENEVARISHDLRVEVAEAVRKADRARDMLQVFEGGMLARADHSLKVAEKSFQIGAVSLLEFLEAERTYNETRAEYLRALDDYRHGLIDVAFTAGEPQ